MNYQSNYGLEEAGMAQMDDSIGALLKHLDDIGEADNTIVIFTTDNGAEVFTWPDGGMTPFRATKGTVFEGGFRVPAIIRWPGKVKPGTVDNGIFSGLDWLPTLAAAAGASDITAQLLKGVKLGDRTYKLEWHERLKGPTECSCRSSAMPGTAARRRRAGSASTAARSSSSGCRLLARRRPSLFQDAGRRWCHLHPAPRHRARALGTHAVRGGAKARLARSSGGTSPPSSAHRARAASGPTSMASASEKVQCVSGAAPGGG